VSFAPNFGAKDTARHEAGPERRRSFGRDGSPRREWRL